MKTDIPHELLDFSENDIAIIAMAGRFPGANHLEAFWDNLLNEQDLISHFSNEALRQAGVEESLIQNPHYVKSGGILKDIDQFDAHFFNMTPYEASITDPQHRLFLELCWEALERAGYMDRHDALRVGVFAGASDSRYLQNNLLKNKTFLKSNYPYQTQIATNNSFLATKVSYYLNLTGPSLNINTACSTSLVTVITGIQALLVGDCDLALAGGVSLRLPQSQGYLYQEGGILSKDGKCRAFDQEASGTVLSAGAGVVVLKRLNDALRDKDSIEAVIKSYGINNDGAAKIGYTAPSVLEQSRCIATALSQVAAESIGYLEAHGTGTPLGDPIEILALSKAFSHFTDKKQYCALGSIKTNLGHANIAAGIAGLIKTVLVLKNAVIPASLHFQVANPNIDFEDSPFYVNRKVLPWEQSSVPRRAGISSFGIGGSNAHVILEEGPQFLDDLQEDRRKYHPLLFSAKSKTALHKMASNLAEFLKKQASIAPGDRKQLLVNTAFSLQCRRLDFSERYVVLCDSIDDAIQQLDETHGSFASIDAPACFRKKIPWHALLAQETAVEDSLAGLKVLAQAWLAGEAIDWAGYYKAGACRRIPLPSYPFDRSSCWFEADPLPLTSIKTTRPESELTRCFYETSWIRSEALDSLQVLDFSKIKNKTWILFIKKDPLGQDLFQRLSACTADVICLYSDDSNADNYFKAPLENNHRQNEYRVNPKDTEAFKGQLQFIFKTITSDCHLIYAWGQEALSVHPEPDAISDALDQGLYSLAAIVQVYGAEVSYPLSLLIVNSGLHAVFSRERVSPVKAAILGACPSIPLEYEQIHIASLDVLKERNVVAEGLFSDYLIAETLKISGYFEVKHFAYRGGYRWEKIYRCLEVPAARDVKAPLVFKDQGVYLITGGLGGIGLGLARYILSKTLARVVLISRKRLPPVDQWPAWLLAHTQADSDYALIADLADLQANQGGIVVYTADVASYAQMQAVVCLIEKEWGAISGVFHIAGLAGSGLLQKKTREDVSTALHAKLFGTYVLAQIFREKPLDFVVLFSSLTALVGGLGQFAYGAANAALDAFPFASCFHPATRVSSLNWNAWLDLGMFAEALKDAFYSERDPDGMNKANSISLEEGFFCLALSLEQKIKNLIISRFSLNYLIKYKQKYKLSTVVKKEPITALDATSHALSLEDKISFIFQSVLGVERVALEDDFFDLGGDSLAALSLMDALEKQFAIRLSLNQITEIRSPANLIEWMKTRCDQPATSSFLLLNATAETPALFLVHPVGGTIFCYITLSHYLKNQKIYAIEDPGLSEAGCQFHSLKEMAAYYLSEIQKIQKKGPYYLGGYSMGGSLAFEMAHQLIEKGESVAFLGLFDSWANFTTEFQNQGFFETKMRKHLTDSERHLKAFLGDKIEAWLQNQWQRMVFLLEYQPPVLDCTIRLFKASLVLPEYRPIDDPSNHWQAYSNRPVETMFVSGDHDSLFSRSNMAVLSTSLSNCLMKAKEEQACYV